MFKRIRAIKINSYAQNNYKAITLFQFFVSIGLALYMFVPKLHVYVLTLIGLISVNTTLFAAIGRIVVAIIIILCAIKGGLSWNFRVSLWGYAFICFWILWILNYLFAKSDIFSSNFYVQNIFLYVCADIFFPCLIVLGMKTEQIPVFLKTYLLLSIMVAGLFFMLPRTYISLGTTRLTIGSVSAKNAAVYAFQALVLWFSFYVYPLSKYKRLAFGLVGLITLSILGLSLELFASARAALIAVIFVLVYELIVTARINIKRSIIVGALWIILGLSFLTFYKAYPGNDIFGIPIPSYSFRTLFSFRSYSFQGGAYARLEHFRAALNSLRGRWFFGVGPRPEELASGAGFDTPWAHNIWLDTLMNVGLVGLLFFLIVIVLSFKEIFETLRHSPSRFKLGLLSIYLFVMVTIQVSGGVTNNSLWIFLSMILGPMVNRSKTFKPI